MASHKFSLTRRTIRNIGELLITAGVVILLYVFWQLFINDPLVGANQQNQANKYQNPTSTTMPGGLTLAPIEKGMKQGTVFAKIYIPRFDPRYVRLVGQGTFQKVTLNKIGPGHYLNTAWPGQVGNFAVAAHRTSHGAPFFKIDTLQAGDKIFIETADTWYVYDYRQTKVVLPTDVGVIRSVPIEMDGAHKGGSYMTMTSCNPKWSNTQRIIVWSELEYSQPTSLGMPVELSKLQGQKAN